MKKLIALCLSIFVGNLTFSANNVMADSSPDNGKLTLIPIVSENYFKYDPVNDPKNIYEKEDITQACYFSLDGLKMLPVNLFLYYSNPQNRNHLKLGITAMPSDKETVITYYFPTDEISGECLYPMGVITLAKITDKYYHSYDDGHQAKHHTKVNPIDPHQHRVVNHPEEIVTFYDENNGVLDSQSYGVCRSLSHIFAKYDSYPLMILEWIVRTISLDKRLPETNWYKNCRYRSSLEYPIEYSIDDNLKETLNIPALIPMEDINPTYQSIVRAAIMFNLHPKIECLFINNQYIFNHGSEDLKESQEWGECVSHHIEYTIPEVKNQKIKYR